MKQIDTWKQESVESLVNYVQEVKARDDEWRSKYGFYRFQYESYRKECPAMYVELSKCDSATILKKATEMVEAKYTQLQAKVEKKIGTILEISADGNNGYDFIFLGTTGSCRVEVIGAGGYNIQRYHTRWIIKP